MTTTERHISSGHAAPEQHSACVYKGTSIGLEAGLHLLLLLLLLLGLVASGREIQGLTVKTGESTEVALTVCEELEEDNKSLYFPNSRLSNGTRANSYSKMGIWFSTHPGTWKHSSQQFGVQTEKPLCVVVGRGGIAAGLPLQINNVGWICFPVGLP